MNIKRDNFIIIILAVIGVLLLIYCSKYLIGFYINTDCVLDSHQYKISNKQILDANEFGDYFGGVMNPLIGLTAAFITFLAFYIQFVANKQITNQFKIQQFESQFYEMLRLHKENVNEIQIDKVVLIPVKSDRNSSLLHWEKSYQTIKGRDCFIYFSNELEIAYKLIHKSEEEKEKVFKKVYKVFFNGIDYADQTNNFNSVLLAFRNDHIKTYIERTDKARKIEEKLEGILILAKYTLFEGHENKLGHYYRHLYHTVKFVANYDEKILDYKDKRKYLRLLRAQLSNYEQAMLFYNWHAGHGSNWETDNPKELNKFFSDFRMIHNLHDKIFFDKEYFVNIKKSIKDKNPNYKTIPDKENDFLFESDTSK
jgi:hypothetical protein